MDLSVVRCVRTRYVCCDLVTSISLPAFTGCRVSIASCCAQKRLLIGGTATAAGFVAAYRNDLTQLQFDTFSAFGPFLRLLDAESSHNVAVWTAKRGIVPRDRRPDITCLGVSVWGREFPNPIGEWLPLH